MKTKRISVIAIVFGILMMVFFTSCKKEDSGGPAGLNVVSTYPVNDATNVTTHLNVVIEFDKNIDWETTGEGIKLYRADGLQIPIEIVATEKTIDFYPIGGSYYPYAYGTKYKVKITSKLKAEDGSSAKDYEFSFTTEVHL